MLAPTLVFDLDGTLVDTAPDLVATLNHVFAGEGLSPVPFTLARNMVGGGARLMIERGLAAEGRTLAEPERERLYQEFIAYYAAHIADRSRPFPGVEAVCDILAKRGFRLAVCTNKLEWLARRLLDTLGLSTRFAAICGADTFGVSKPDRRMFEATVAKAGGHPGAAVMIGDSETDVATARAAGIPIIAVAFGYSETPIAELAPDRLIADFAELPLVVEDLLEAGKREFARQR
jgi:phosphoglycolate phosphatase